MEQQFIVLNRNFPTRHLGVDEVLESKDTISTTIGISTRFCTATFVYKVDILHSKYTVLYVVYYKYMNMYIHAHTYCGTVEKA